MKCLQNSGFQLPRRLPLDDLNRLKEAQRCTRLAVASYGSNLLALVGLLAFKAWSSDEVAAARFLGLPAEQVLACAAKEESASRFKPWWVLLTEGNDLVLSIRGSANLDDVATDLTCATCEFLHGFAHDARLPGGVSQGECAVDCCSCI